MPRHLHGPFTLTIVNAASDSGTYAVQSTLGSLDRITFFAPATLPETVTLQVSPIDSPTAGDWKTYTWQPGAVDIAFTAAKALNVPLIGGFRAIRLHATAPVAADRVFQIVVQIFTDSEM